MPDSLQDRISQGRIQPFQVFIIGLCTFLNMLDGFDILIMAFTASSVAEEFGLSNSEVGVLLSAGLFGMAIGAFFIGPQADKFGRKSIALVSLVLISIGMLGAGYSSTVQHLAGYRLLTGIGVGGMIAALNTLVSEYSPYKSRSLAVTIMQTGNPIGATIGGVLSVYLIAQYGWRSTFLFGGYIAVIFIPIVALWLPESVEYLAAKRPKNALVRINSIFKKMNLKLIKQMPQKKGISSELGTQSGIMQLFKGGTANRTLLLCLSFFTVMFSFYYTMSWTPKLLVDAGLSTSQSISGSVIINIGGAIGAIALGVLSGQDRIKKIISIYMLLTAVLMIAFGLFSSNFQFAIILAPLLGFFLFGSIIGLYALAPFVYDVNLRATGIGTAIGVGRIGAVTAPLLAGYFLDIGIKPHVMFVVFALPMLVALFAQKSVRLVNE